MSHATKKRKFHSDYHHKVIIAAYNKGSAQRNNRCDSSSISDDVMFERGHPHWEGRWVGHLHLPFPSLESLDILIDGGSNDAQSDLGDDAIGRVDGDDDKSDNNNSSDESSSDESSSSEDDDMPQSRIFLPIARKLIHRWASLLGDCTTSSAECTAVIAEETKTTTKCNGEDSPSKSPTTFIVPHIPMHPIVRTNNISNKDNNLLCEEEEEEESPISTNNIISSSLHISLARPIYLPTPSVDPFLADIEKSIKAVVAPPNNSRRGSTNHQTGRILYLQPRNATIFTNDEQTRSFLSIPVSNESSRWVKQTLLPPIDATMQRFGLQTYYSTEEEGCILHVSVASSKGNVIPQMLCKRKKLGDNDKNGYSSFEEGASNIRSIPLFSLHDDEQEHDATIESMPSFIPIRIHQIQCQFGKTKQMMTIMI